MAVSMPILSMATNASPLSGRGTFLRPPFKPLHPFRNHLQQLTLYKNTVEFRSHFKAFSSSVKLAESTVIWDAAFSQEEMPPPDPGPSSEPLFISLLLFAAFIGLSLVTIGVVYLGVTEFLEKRERDKLSKEEETEAKSKSKGKSKGKGKNIILAKSGPRGFGQKIDEDD